MNRPQNAKPKSDFSKRLLVLNFILVSILLSCFAFVVDKFIHAIYPNWGMNIFPILTFFITLECLIDRYLQRNISYYSYKFFLQELVEIVLILFLTKFISMMMVDISIFGAGILTWGKTFYKGFLDWHHFLLFFSSFLMWVLAYAFSDALIRLDLDQDHLELESQLRHGFDRQNARQKLIRLIFVLGFLLILLLMILQNNLIDVSVEKISVQRFVPFLLFYFFVAFIFLAINQYAIMKARWYFEDMDPQKSLFNRWILLTLLICISVILVICFIPTNISFNLQPIVQAFSYVLRFIIFIIYYVIVIPFTFVFSLLNALFNSAPIQEELVEGLSELTPPLPVVATPLAWLEILKTILYYVIFIAVFIFSMWFYIRNRKPYVSVVNFPHLFTWIKTFWKFIKNFFNNIFRVTRETIQTSYEKVRIFFTEQSIQLPLINLNMREKPPRQKVINTYINWIQWNQSHGISRGDSQTPFEYASEFISYLPESQEKIDYLTAVFIRARYTKHAITKQEALEAQNLFVILKDTLLQKQKLEEQVIP